MMQTHSHNRLVWTGPQQYWYGSRFWIVDDRSTFVSYPGQLARRSTLGDRGGFATFFFSPALGLPPELPGTTVTEMGPRQLWWLFAGTFTGKRVVAAHSGSPGWLKGFPGAALLPGTAPGRCPSSGKPIGCCARSADECFLRATAIVNAIFWLFLGAVSALCLKPFF
ncbi:MAG: hypothetical protein CM1200mP18_13050 [Gammaproteobacteria bacterium]|nr:MAG: hypothetical protein CM1200mP18_13050 [Gammaproteobacteria bacterium]